MVGGGLRRSEITVGLGLYVLKYVSSSAGPAGPSVEVDVGQGFAGVVELIGDPRVQPGVLPQAGTVMVVRCSAKEAKLVLQAVPRVPGGAVDARVRLEPLDRAVGLAPAEDVPSAGVAEKPAPKPVAARPTDAELQILGHVARRGDVLVKAGEWIAGPSSPLPIEGIMVRGAADAGLEYQVLSGGRGARWSPWAPAGEFAGTRGKALPLVGLRLRLQGSENVVLRVQALFLGAPVVSRSGRQIELIGSSGGDPLVGLSVSLEDAVVEAPVSRASPPNTGPVRIFRAGVL